MLSWVALDSDLARLGFELALVHTKNWCKPEILLGSSKERNWVMASAKHGILGELGVHLVEEEHVEQRQPPHPPEPF